MFDISSNKRASRSRCHCGPKQAWIIRRGDHPQASIWTAIVTIKKQTLRAFTNSDIRSPATLYTYWPSVFFFTSTFREHRGTVFFLNFTSSSYLHILLASKDISVAFSFASHCCRLTLFFYTSSFAFIRLSRSLFSTVNFRTILGPSKPLDFHSKEPIHSPFKLAIALLYPPLHLPSFPPLTT